MKIDRKFNFQFNISEPKQKNNIVIFFLNTTQKLNDNYLTLSDAFSQNLVEVKEINCSGAINYLKVTNNSEKKLLVLESEQIIGDAIKQNRVVNSTTLIPEQSTVMLKVSCCEKNRCRQAVANTLSISKSLYFSKGRTSSSADIFKNQKTDQFKIWDEISDKMKEFKSKSFTGSLEDVYNMKKDNFEEIVKYFNPGENDIGVAIAIGSRLVSLDIFFNSNLLKVYLSKIIRSVILDSYKKNYYQNFINKKNVHKLLRLIEQSEKKMHKTQSGCLGEEIRFNSNQVVGSCLYFENKMLHFSGFLKDDMNIPQFKSKVA
jgi:hypothetical protein